MTEFLGTKNVHLYICSAFIRYKHDKYKKQNKDITVLFVFYIELCFISMNAIDCEILI